MIDARITLDGLNLAELPHGGHMVITRLDGWWDSPEPKGQEVPKVGREGSHLLPQSYEDRIIELGGIVHAPDHDSLHAIGEHLTAMLRTPARLEVFGHGSTQWATVQRGSKIRFTPDTDTLAVYSVTLKAPDSRKYGRTRRYPETGTQPVGVPLQVPAGGKYPAAPRFTVTGYMPGGYTAYAGGTRPFRVTEGVNTGEVLVNDYDTGAVYQDGTRIYGKSSSPRLTWIEPGTMVTANVQAATAEGTGGYFVEITDTYI
jgi:hypothetical protein